MILIPTNHHTLQVSTRQVAANDFQIAPGIFIPGSEMYSFMNDLESDPARLNILVELWNSHTEPITAEHVDPMLWDIYAPILQYLNFQRRILNGEPFALSIAAGMYDYRTSQQVAAV